MNIFKKKNNEYDNASMNLNNSSNKSSDRIIFQQLENDDQNIAYLVDEMKKGNPLVVDFGTLEIKAANKMLAFLAGASYASDAKSLLVREGVYLFARNIDFIDGSLDEFLRNL